MVFVLFSQRCEDFETPDDYFSFETLFPTIEGVEEEVNNLEGEEDMFEVKVAKYNILKFDGLMEKNIIPEDFNSLVEGIFSKYVFEVIILSNNHELILRGDYELLNNLFSIYMSEEFEIKPELEILLDEIDGLENKIKVVRGFAGFMVEVTTYEFEGEIDLEDVTK